VKNFILWVCIVLLTASAKAEESAPTAASDALVLEVRATRIERSELERALRKELAGDHASGEAAASGHLELTERDLDTVRLSYRDASGKLATRELRIARDDPEALEKISLAAANLVRDQSALIAELDALAPPPSAAPPAPLPPEYNPCAATPVLVFGGDLAPFLGTSSVPAGRNAARRVSLNLAGSYSAGVRGFEASIGFNIDRRGVCGFQGAAGFNLSLGPVRGVQLAVVNLAAGRVRGTQLGVANFTRRHAVVQLGVGNFALEGAGFQLGVGNIALGDSGGQLGVGNLAWGNVRRLQLGVANIAKGDVPFQLGVVNVSRHTRVPIGVVSIVRQGRTTVDAWATENGTLLAGISHGGDIVHNIYGVGARVGSKGTRLVYTLGIGARLFSHPRFKLDLDGLFEHVARVDAWRSVTTVSRLRLSASITLHDRIALLVAPGYAIMQTDDAEEGTQAPVGESTLARGKRDGSDVVYGFPSLALGLRIALSDRR
jgi:hypothetical protein